MTQLEARILRIEQTLGLEPVDVSIEEIKKLHSHVGGHSLQEAKAVVKQAAIDKEFEMNMNHYPDREDD
jgi:hypothetical protein